MFNLEDLKNSLETRGFINKFGSNFYRPEDDMLIEVYENEDGKYDVYKKKTMADVENGGEISWTTPSWLKFSADGRFLGVENCFEEGRILEVEINSAEECSEWLEDYYIG